MKFNEITEDAKVYPGEYILHAPTNQVVICGSFNRGKDSIRVLSGGKMFADKISNFRKIQIGKEERSKRPKRRGCGGCGKK